MDRPVARPPRPRTEAGASWQTGMVRKRRPLAKLIGDLWTGRTPRGLGRHPVGPALTRPVSARKPPARADGSVRLEPEAGRRLAGSQIMIALTKATRSKEAGRRRPEQKSARDRKRRRAS